MKTRFMTAWVTITILLASGQALAQLPDFRAGNVLRAAELNAMVEQINRNTAALVSGGGANPHTVDCASATIADAMAQAQPGDTILISGTCTETVVVDKDGITLDGQGSAVIDGSGGEVAVINVTGHQNVVIRGLTVRNDESGVLANRGAAVWLEDVTARDNNEEGIAIRANSIATFAGTLIANENDRIGIEVGQQSHMASGGATLLQANMNGSGGIAIHRGGQMVLSNVSRIEANANYEGIWIFYNSLLAVNLFGGEASRVEVANNQNQGIWMAGNTYSALEGAVLSVTGNGGNGLSVNTNSVVDAFAGYTFGDVEVPNSTAVFNDNGGAGVSVTANSRVGFGGGVTVRNNEDGGISAWNGADVDLSNATVTGNTGSADIEASLGSRLGWDGDTTIGTVDCDDSTLTYNDAACP